MCRSCTKRLHVSRRRLLGLGMGAGAMAAAGTTLGVGSASAASLRNGQWCNPTLGSFPDGGQYGAPRGSGSHAGQDVSNSIGTAVYAAASGTVVRREWGGGLPYRTGYAIVVAHGDSTYTYYGHLSQYRVSEGEQVSSGERIADMGATGNVTGPHLHFEVHNGGLGSTTDPVPFMRDRGVNLGGGWSRIDPGASGATVTVIQCLLNQHGNDLQVDGDYGSISVDAVKDFQDGAGLYVDGQVGPKTWPHLVFELREDDSGDHVRALQRALNKRSAGLRVDGNFGPVTDDAVRTYQRANRLYVDGLAGPVTWRALVG